MIISDAESTTITNFNGANQLQDEEDIQPPDAISLQNSEFVEGSTSPRRGFGLAWNPGKYISAMWNWFQSNFNYLMYLDRNGGAPQMIRRDLGGIFPEAQILASTDIGTSAVGMVATGAGYRMMAAFHNAAGAATTEGWIWDGTFTNSTPNTAKLFQRAPLTTELVITASETATGQITQGLHNIAVVVQSWNGATTPPGPITLGGVLLPTAFTSSGGKNLQIVVTPVSTWPLWVNSVQIAFTPQTNANRWFLVPGTITPVGRGSSFAVTITITLSDVVLTSVANNEITNTLFNLYTQLPTGTGPFSPHCILPYNQRMAYIARLPGLIPGQQQQGAIFFSQASNPQYITLAFHLQQLPEFLDIITGFVQGASCFVCGPDWTYSFNDNTQYPVQWAPARLISRDVGTPFIKGVLANPAYGITWICARRGLFAFNGTVFDQQPSSYKQGYQDWQRINWNAPADTLQIIDYPDYRIVLVMAPLDGATKATHFLAFDYSKGFDYQTIRYCGPWWINAGANQINPGAIAKVFNSTNGAQETWVSTASATVTGKVYRQKYIPADASVANPVALYDDDGAGIDANYRMADVIPQEEQPYFQQLGATWRVSGNGTANLSVYSRGQSNPKKLAPISLSLAPGQSYLRTMDKQSQGAFYQISNGAVAGSFYRLAAIKAYFRRWMEQGNT